MLSSDAIDQIRRDHFEKGIPLREIARDRNLSRNTVRKAVRSGDLPFRYERKSQPRPKLGPWTGALDNLLEENRRQHCQDRQPLTRLHEQLVSLGYDGGYDAVRRYAVAWRQSQRQTSPPQAAIPQRFEPGEAYRFDWSQEDVVLGGAATRVHVAHIRLCHSHMFLVQAYPRATLEMWCDAHERAFEFLGGACRTGIYNHMKPAVRRLVAISAGMFKPELCQLCGHYGIKPAACMPGEDWERGTSERQLRNSRRNLFLPRPEAASYPELNAWLAKRCIREAKRQIHPSIETRTIWQVYKDERLRLAALGQPFNGCREFEMKASTGCLVPFDHNHYSVHAGVAGRKVTIRAYADRISVLLDGEEVAEHPRSFGRGRIVYDPWHYVPMLPGKPCALTNGAPFRNWQPPGALGRMRSKLSGCVDGDRQFVSILSEIPRVGLKAVEAACAGALDHGDCTHEGVARILDSAQAEPHCREAVRSARRQ